MTTGEAPAPQNPTPGSTAERTLAWAAQQGLATWFARETTSTNTIAKSRVTVAGALLKPMLFLTERQTAGRGRGDHTWATPKDALLSTWSYPLTFAPQPILSPLVGLALFDAARRAFIDVAFNLKAPNDLYVGSKKIAGLLIETVMMGSQVTCAVGLGFNADAAPAGFDETAVGLSSLLPAEMIASQWPLFLSAWVDGLTDAFSQARVPELRDDARARLTEALNLRPSLNDRVLDVGPLGQIQTSSRLIHWHEL